jgi:ArsR family transcriptional regulator
MKNGALRSTLKVTKALADLQRLRILMLLRQGELCVCQIIAVLGLAPSTVSKHLSLLSEADLVVCRKEGRWAHYRLAKGFDYQLNLPVLKWLQVVLVSDEQVLRDAEALKRALACSPGLLVTRQRQAKVMKKEKHKNG